LENDGAERIDVEGGSSTYQMEMREEKQNVAPQNEQHGTQRVMTDKYAAREKLELDSRKVAAIEKARVLANLAGYSIHSSSFFKVGKVFKVLWSEPVGDGGTKFTVSTMGRGETAFPQIRRFIVVMSSERHSICV
jgi:hypothetical protein